MPLVDIILLLLLVLSLFLGFRSGLLHQILSLLSILLSGVLAYFFLPYVSKQVFNYVDYSGVLVSALLWLFLFVLLLVFTKFLLRISKGAIKLPLLSLPNRILGACLSLLITAFVLSGIINVYERVVGYVPITTNDAMPVRGAVYKTLRPIAPTILSQIPRKEDH